MKKVLVIGVLIGMVIGGLLVAGPLYPIATQAQAGDASLAALLPDIEKIYQEALLSPLNQVEGEIEDEDIARYYHHLLESCELDTP